MKRALLAASVLVSAGTVVFIYLGLGVGGGFRETSLGQDVFPQRSIDLGEFFVGATKEVEVIVKNPLAHDIFIFGLNPTCGCLLPAKFSGKMVSGEEKRISVQVSPVVQWGGFRERLVLQASDAEIDGISLRIEGTVGHKLYTLEEPDFGLFESENGAETIFSLSLPDITDYEAIDCLIREGSELLSIHSVFPGARFELDKESVAVERTTTGGAIISGRILIGPSSARGRIGGVRLILRFPDILGGGHWTTPIVGAFLCAVSTDPAPEVNSRSKHSLFSSPALFLVKVENPGEAGKIRFPTSSGIVEGYSWKVVHDDSNNIYIRISASKNIVDGSTSTSTSIRIPYRLQEKEGQLSILVRG